MSYDVDIGGQSFNYTYNVYRLFDDHMPNGIRGLDGMTGAQAARCLSDVMDAIHRTVLSHWHETDVGEPKFCAVYDSPNGWGSAIGGILFLSQIMAACQKFPRHKVRVS